eukprot:2042501-Amphidinium_carterae.1
MQSTSLQNFGRMMWAREAVEFWQTAPGGSHSVEASEAKWSELEKNYAEHVHAFEGPNPRKPLRIRIKMHDEVLYSNDHVREQESS